MCFGRRTIYDQLHIQQFLKATLSGKLGLVVDLDSFVDLDKEEEDEVH
jgi:hypothetical protein